MGDYLELLHNGETDAQGAYMATGQMKLSTSVLFLLNRTCLALRRLAIVMEISGGGRERALLGTAPLRGV